ncbi:MAG: electron transfer flavoprotein subunit alpha/FixB family protein, partial [Proteobacteria bacterium]|nr:electron transfer flavoprotein subunit alpha/FixB family protein [Pseudomonadota bacterium]
MSNRPVLICGEIEGDGISSSTLELMRAGKKIADDLGAELSLVIIGNNISGIADEAASYGANKVYKIESPLVEKFMADLWVGALEKLCAQVNPKVLLMSHTNIGMEVAPRLAFRLKTRLTTDCTDLEADKAENLLLCTKPVYGGNAVAIFKYKEEPHFATVRKKIMAPAEKVSNKSEIINVAPDMDASAVKIESLKIVQEDAVSLDKAEIIISGGRGIGGSEGFKELEEMAELMRKSSGSVVEIGGSRPAVDLGWLPSSRQVGLTGEKVSPDLYVAIGISGATQHLVGMMRSKKIVAINKDKKASIFNIANYGIVGDYKEIIPAFNKKWRELS